MDLASKEWHDFKLQYAMTYPDRYMYININYQINTSFK